jgi:hypothetical protein
MAFDRRRAALLFSATVLGSALMGFEPAVLRDVAIEQDGLRIGIGAVRTPLWNAAFAQTGPVRLENVTFTFGPNTYEAREITLSGLSSSKAELDALFDQNATEPFAARLGRLSAREIAIPELTARQTIGAVTQVTRSRNVTASGVDHGRVAHLAIEASSIEMEGGARTGGTVTQGRTSAEGVDLAAIARVYSEKAGPEPGVMATLYDFFTVDDIRIADPEGNIITIARGQGRGVRGRPTQDSWAGTASLVTALTELDKPSEADAARLLSSAADLASAIEIGTLEFTGIETSGRKQDFNGKARVARIAFRAGGNGEPADARLEGLEITGPNTRARIGTIALTGFSFAPTLSELKSFRGKSFEQVDAATIRRLIPTVGTLHLSVLDFDVPNEEAKGAIPDKIRFTLKNFELTADQPRNGIPTNLRLALQNFAMPLPSGDQDETVETLKALGYKDVDLSFSVAAAWNEAKNEIAIRDVSYSAPGLGSIAVQGMIGNVSPDVFDPDTAIASVALIGAAVQSLDVTVQNDGLVDRFIARDARKQKKSPEAVRREYATAAAVAVPALLGGSAQAKALGQAVGRFVAKPGRLVVHAKAKSPSGLGLVEAMSVTEPGDVLGKVDISASVEDRR